MMQGNSGPGITWKEIGAEPYRLFFPTAVLAGMVGAALWPLHFGHVVKLYPGQAHARIMACGLLGGFIFGFLGTAMPRMLSAPALGARNVLFLVLLHVAMVTCYALQKLSVGDHLFLLEVVWVVILLANRVRMRGRVPPPGFSLAGLALLCALAGALLGVAEQHIPELDARWVLLRRLLLYQGFLLFPVLGISPFLLPRFFGLESESAFPPTRVPERSWIRKAGLALFVGMVILASFVVEIQGWHRLAYAARFAGALFYCALEFRFLRARVSGGALGLALWIALGLVLTGFGAIALFPAYRVSLLHLSLIGGFSVMAFVVATRVMYGHSGNLAQLQGPNRWIIVVLSLMLLATATRASADFWPAITISHYIYGALAWIIAAVIWSVRVLPKAIVADPE